MTSQWDLLSDVIPNDRAVQVTSMHYLRSVGSQLPPGAVVVDLGCGNGSTANKLRRINESLFWVGVDISASPEVDARTLDNTRSLVTFDGVNLPFADCSVACVYSHQALEHVRHPDQLLREVGRVLLPGGFFIGSTSNLEPYHSFSYWNFTPFGFRRLVEEAGMKLTEIRPGIDGLTLIERQVRGRPPELSRFFVDTSPLNEEIIRWGARSQRRPALVNNRMLQFCGQFAFLAVSSDERLPIQESDADVRVLGPSPSLRPADVSTPESGQAQRRNRPSLLRRLKARVRNRSSPISGPSRSQPVRPSLGELDVDIAAVRRGWQVRREFDLKMPSISGAHGGHIRIACPTDLYIPKVLEKDGLRGYEAETLSVALAFAGNISSDTWFFDVGANIGVFSWVMTSAGAQRSIAFEPTPVIALAARNTSSENHLSIEVEELALGDITGQARLYISNTTDASNSLNQAFRRVDDYVDVATTSLDSYVSNTARIPGLIKIDTESTEPAVIGGAITTLRAHRPPIICEVLRDSIGEQVADLLDELEYTYYPIGDNLPLVASDEIRAQTDSQHRNWLLAPSPVDAVLLAQIEAWRLALDRCGPASMPADDGASRPNEATD